MTRMTGRPPSCFRFSPRKRNEVGHRSGAKALEAGNPIATIPNRLGTELYYKAWDKGQTVHLQPGLAAPDAEMWELPDGLSKYGTYFHARRFLFGRRAFNIEVAHASIGALQ